MKNIRKNKAHGDTEMEEPFGQGQAEVTRDEFGGYCCKRWGVGADVMNVGSKKEQIMARNSKEQVVSEDNICKLLGLDINRTALEIVKADLKRKEIPIAKASKYLAAMNPYSNSTQLSGGKSLNASASKLSTSYKTPSTFVVESS